RLVDRAVFFQDAQQFRDRRLTEGLAVRQRQLEGRGLEVRAEDQQVVRVDQSLLRVSSKEILGMVDQVLIERAARRHVDGGRGTAAPAGAADLLPGAGDRSGIPAENGGIEVPDVDSQLEGVGANHAADRSVAKTVLDLAPLQRQVPTAVAADRPRLAQPVGERLLQVAEQDFDLQARASEDDGLHPAAQKRLGDLLALQGGGAPDAKLAIDHWRVVKEQALGSARGT